MLDEKKTCITCRRPFFPAVISQDECSSCMVSPSRKSSTYNDFQIEDDGVTPTINQETNMPLPPKQCIKCRNLYEPSSNRQQICPKCRDEAEPQKATKLSTEPVVPFQSQDRVADYPNHYEAALELVRELLASDWRVTATKGGIKLTVEVEK